MVYSRTSSETKAVNSPASSRKSSLSGTSGDSEQSDPSSCIPLDRPSRSHCIRMAACILVMELCERLTYYSVSGNIVIYCTSVLKMDDEQASTVALVFTGFSYFLPLFGGWIADSIAGKYNTIYGAGLCYVVGTAALPLAANNWGEHHKLMPIHARYAFFVLALVMICCGTGGIKSNISPFGAEQVQSLGEGAIRSFFNWFYWFINIGSFLAFSIVVWLQQEKGFFYGLLPPFVAVVVSIVIFVSARNDYICRPPQGSAFRDVFGVIFHALSQKYKHGSVVRKRLPDLSNKGLLDYARISYGGKYSDKQVDTVRCLKQIVIIFAAITFYWTVYFQMQTSMLLQAECMNLYVGSFRFPAASLNLFDCVIILLLIPIMDGFVYPFLFRRGVVLTQLRRVGIGMVLASISVVIAGILEYHRRNTLSGKTNKIGNSIFNASSLSVFYQVPQFLVIGASEIFTSISGLEFAYVQAPKYLQGVIMGLFLATSGIGAFLGSALVNVVSYVSRRYGVDWYAGNINEGRLDRFFYLLGGLMFLDFLVFAYLAYRYEYVHPDKKLNEEAIASPYTSRRPSLKSDVRVLLDEPDIRASSPRPGDPSVADGLFK